MSHWRIGIFENPFTVEFKTLTTDHHSLQFIVELTSDYQFEENKKKQFRGNQSATIFHAELPEDFYPYLNKYAREPISIFSSTYPREPAFFKNENTPKSKRGTDLRWPGVYESRRQLEKPSLIQTTGTSLKGNQRSGQTYRWGDQ